MTINTPIANPDGSWTLFVQDDSGRFDKVDVPAGDTDAVQVLDRDGAARSERVLAGMWTQWMAAASTNARSTLLASSPLDPYAHQAQAVYGAMLPQPWLRFLLADEPGTGKTIMAGLYLREMQRSNLIRKALVVAPAGLVSKWQADFERFFGGGLRRITSDTVREHALDVDHDLWVVSLELAAVNPAVQDAIRPDKAGWDAVVFDEAHKLTPTAQSLYRVGRLLSRAPRALLMTATPHRGSEWLFRHLLHLVDPDIYPDPGDDAKAQLDALRPGSIHFLRRMKEDLVDYDGVTKLFKGRRATNARVPLGLAELTVYNAALAMVDAYFPPTAQPLARMVYGKRTASCLHSLSETLKRRRDRMGEQNAAEAAIESDPYGEDESERDLWQVVNADSQSARAEKRAIAALLDQIDGILADPGYTPSKWRRLTQDCLAVNGIRPGGTEQAVLFTEYADTAAWLAERLGAEGFSARVYSGRLTHPERDEVRAAFMRGDFQIIVTTDAGNEGIDLQAAHVLVNYDIPWSLVRLEQRMGRIHRVGQMRDVELYNLVATDTREGDTLHTLLERFVTAANELNGQMFDSLSLVAELTGINYDTWLTDLYGDDETAKSEALAAAKRVTTAQLREAAHRARTQEQRFAEKVKVIEALALLHEDYLERVNPAIVDAYLTRLADSGLVTVKKTSLGEDVRQVAAAALPAGLGGGQKALVAISGDALRGATLAGSIVRALGPGDAAFAALIGFAETAFEPDLYRSGTVQDPTSVTPYDLYAFRAELSEAGGSRVTEWATLVRVDATGTATPVNWATLANLVPTGTAGPLPHPAQDLAALETAKRLAVDTERTVQEARDKWFETARRDLTDLPTDLTPSSSFPNHAERVALRTSLRQKTEQRLAELERLAVVSLTNPRPVARLHVLAAGRPETPEEKDSEAISMRNVAGVLTRDGWQVSDVHLDGHGYDLRARRGREQRLVEVKGIWGAASSTGVRMTGREVLMATQHGDDYWLYVVDGCADATGTLFGTYQNPVKVFASDITADAIFKVPGSSLSRAAGQEDYQ